MARPKGSSNKVTRDMREFVRAFLEDNIDGIQRDFDSLSPGERLRFIERLFAYVIPKQTAVHVADELSHSVKPTWFDEAEILP